MSKGEDYRGPWNEGPTTQMGEELRYVEDPLTHVRETNGLLQEEISGTARTPESAQEKAAALAAVRGAEINNANPPGAMQWSTYGNTDK